VGLLNTPSPAGLFIHSSGGELPPPTLRHSVPEVRHCYKPSSLHTRWRASPHPPSWQSCLQYVGDVPLTLSLELRVPRHLWYMPFFQLLVYYSVFFVVAIFIFYGTGVGLSRGLCCFILGVAVGVPCGAYLITCWSVSPKQVRSLCLVAWEPSCFLCISWRGEAMCRLGCRGVRVLPLLVGFSCQLCLQHLGKTFTLRNTC
jgi:hypothetical protein